MTNILNAESPVIKLVKFAEENGCKAGDLIIRVVNPEASIRLVGKTSPTSLRGKRWAELLKCEGKTIKHYFEQARANVAGGIANNNPELAIVRGLITVEAPAQAKAAPASSKPAKTKAKKKPDLPALASEKETKAA